MYCPERAEFISDVNRAKLQIWHSHMVNTKHLP
nr:MAG TPA: hypothetical protein [Bacteriophage sp.]